VIGIRIVAMLALLALPAACSPPVDPDARAEAGSANAAAPAAREPKAAGCAAGLAVDLDRSEVAERDWRAFPRARLDGFRSRAADAFRSAADAACRQQPELAAKLKPIRTLLVQSGSGATEPVFYQEDGRDEALIFQYAFAEAKLGVPERDAIELGLRCWADAERKECAEMGD
jgi:hypothetical protein